MTIYYESVNVLITGAALQLPKGVNYPIENISKVEMGKFAHKRTLHIGATIVLLGICLLIIARFGGGIWQGNLIYIPLLLAGFATLSVWFFKRRHVLFIVIDGKQKEVISLPIWKGGGVESLHNISKAINQSIAGISKT
jgi:hypothetical protein